MSQTERKSSYRYKYTKASCIFFVIITFALMLIKLEFANQIPWFVVILPMWISYLSILAITIQLYRRCKKRHEDHEAKKILYLMLVFLIPIGITQIIIELKINITQDCGDIQYVNTSNLNKLSGFCSCNILEIEKIATKTKCYWNTIDNITNNDGTCGNRVIPIDEIYNELLTYVSCRISPNDMYTGETVTVMLGDLCDDIIPNWVLTITFILSLGAIIICDPFEFIISNKKQPEDIELSSEITDTGQAVEEEETPRDTEKEEEEI